MTAGQAPASAPATGLREERDGAVAVLTIDRPEARNALSTAVLEALADTLDRIDADPGVRCTVLAGSAKVFASGADLRDLQAGDAVTHLTGRRGAAWAAIRRTRTPKVAAVSGFCLGGGLELALICDVIVASETARLGLPETSLGLIPAAGGTQRLPAAIGRAKALDVILTGRLLSAEEAERAGLISRVAGADDWLAEALSAARAIAERGPLAQRLAKETVDAAGDVPFAAGLELERRAFAIALSSDEGREGVAAFLDKRPPAWKRADRSTNDHTE